MTMLLPASLGASSSSAFAAEGRIINGSSASATDVSTTGRWSAVVAIFATDAQGTRLCTGTLIAPNWVATAAHCIAQSGDATKGLPASDVMVASGVTSVSSASDHFVGAVSTWVHPGFSWDEAAWDAALIELQSTVPATPFALPDPRTPDAYATGTGDNVAGFGRSQASGATSSGALRSGRLDAASTAACNGYTPGASEYADCYLPGPGRQATCFGDSGGPLVRFDSAGRTVLWGITSTGPDPCDAALGGAFAPSFETRVVAVVGWMNAVRSGSTYVPTSGTLSRSTNAPTQAAPNSPASAASTNRVSKSPLGGTGIGIFSTKVGRAPTRKRPGSVSLSASFVGATGKGAVEIERCARSGCRIVSRSAIDFATAGTVTKAEVKLPRCAARATMTLRLTVTDAAGTKRDAATQRLLRCS